MVNKRPPYTPEAAGFGSSAASTLANNGFNVVRLGLIYSAVEPRPGVFDEHYIESVAATVATLASHGVYTLLDFHQDDLSTLFGGEGFPAWSVETDGLPVRRYTFPLGYVQSAALNRAFDNFWNDKPGPGGIGLQERYADAWRQVANRFVHDPWVLGYDVMNEPWPAHADAAKLAAFYEKVIAAIRTVDPRHLIWYEPFVVFNFGVPTQLSKLGDPMLGMSFHDYCAPGSSPGAPACSADEQRTISNALSRSGTTGDALLLSEFGGTNDTAALERVVTLADSHFLPWIEWAYCGCRDPTGTRPPSVEELVVNPREPGTGGNVVAAKLAVLAEPYAQAVSGTPLSASFDNSTHTFELAYSTTSPDGHRFGPGSCTTVVVPRVQYPTGYKVTVSGGRVESGPSSGVIDVAQAGTTGQVTLTVTPAVGGHTDLPATASAGCS